jgi:hypothetical protein
MIVHLFPERVKRVNQKKTISRPVSRLPGGLEWGVCTTNTPFARRQSELDHFQWALSNESVKSGNEEAWSVDCEGVGALNGLSGLEPERKQRKVA